MEIPFSGRPGVCVCTTKESSPPDTHTSQRLLKFSLSSKIKAKEGRVGSPTFKGDVCPIVQEEFSRLDQPKLSDLQQRVAHAFLVKSRLGLAFQQLLENQKFALIFGRRPGAFTNRERMDEYETGRDRLCNLLNKVGK